MGLDVREYRGLDRVKRTMTGFAKHEAGVSERMLSAAETYATELMSSFELPLGPLFGVVDDLVSEG